MSKKFKLFSAERQALLAPSLLLYFQPTFKRTGTARARKARRNKLGDRYNQPIVDEKKDFSSFKYYFSFHFIPRETRTHPRRKRIRIISS